MVNGTEVTRREFLTIAKRYFLALALPTLVGVPLHSCRKKDESSAGSSGAIAEPIPPEDPTTPYSAVKLNVSGATEYRFFLSGYHFMSVIDDGNGTFALRPHPGDDVNGWGSTWYAQAFLPGAILRHTAIGPIRIKTDTVSISAFGKVSYRASETYGDWNMNLDFTYNKSEKKIRGTGRYSIALAGRLSDATSNLNLYKIASNYLDDVPLLGGGVGNAGDMARADIVRSVYWAFSWIPDVDGNNFPIDKSDKLSVDVIGRYNNVDTVAQGFKPIQPAYKPNMKVILTSRNPQAGITFGAIYDRSIHPQYNIPKSKLFFEDNVAITPLIYKTSENTAFDFDVEFESTPLPGG